MLTGWDDWSDIVLILKKGHETLERRLKDKPWYFTVKTVDFNKLGGEKRFGKSVNAGTIEKFVEKGDYTLIYCKYTSKNPLVSKIVCGLKKLGVVTYESDLSRTKRYLVDNKVPIAEDLNILYFDIETDDSSGAGIKIGRDRILSWAAYNNRGKSWYYDVEDEKALLQRLIRLIDKHDIFVGWNSQKFDLPYIQSRMEKYGLKYDWRRRIHLDLMKRCIKLYTYEMDKIGLTGFALNEVARVFLGEEKVKHEEGIKEMYDNNRELLEKYNRKDSELLMKLDAKLGIIQLMINECKWTGTTLDRFYVGELLDNYMLRKSKDLKQYLYSRPTYEEAEANKVVHIIGGYVKPPITGLYTDVRIFDFKSLYPSMIVSWNIGPDSMDREKSKLGDVEFRKFLTDPDRKIEDVDFNEWYNFLMKQKKRIDPKNECWQTANNNFFRTAVDSFISSLVEELLELRGEMKKKLEGLKPGSPEYGSTRSSQAIVKELANCLHPSTTLYVHDVDADIYRAMSVKEIHDSNKQYEIQSYNFKNDAVEWQRISKIWKTSSQHLIAIKPAHSLQILCTPEHRLFATSFVNPAYRKNRNQKSILSNSHMQLTQLSILELRKKTACDLQQFDLLVNLASTTYTQAQAEYLDLRKHDYSVLKSVSTPMLHLSCAQKKYRNQDLVQTSSAAFNELVQSRYVNRHKQSKQSNNRYHHMIELDDKLWDAVKALTLEEVIEYELRISLSDNGHRVPLAWRITDNLLWVFGMYVAEGSGGIKKNSKGQTTGGIVVSNTNTHYTDRVKRTFVEVGLHETRIKNNAVGCAILNALIGEFFSKECYTSQTEFNATTKSVPRWIFSQSKKEIASFIKGYADGDGNSKHRDNYIRCTTVSKQLVYQISDLLRYVYERPVEITTAPPANDNCNVSYRMLMNLNVASSIMTYSSDKAYTLDSIRNIGNFEYSGDVYDIEVEKNHNFFIGCTLSHNSMYGITGDRTSRYFDKNVAESITITGQFLNKAVSSIFEKVSSQKVIYGDSVVGSTKIRFNDRLLTFDELWKKFEVRAVKRGTKDIVDFDIHMPHAQTYSMLSKKAVLTDRNIEKKQHVSKMIRHWTTKELYEITTESGKKVVVTKDHSMIVNRNGKNIVVQPAMINMKTDLLYCKTKRKKTTPSTAFKKNSKPWCTGLTKNSDARVATRANMAAVGLREYYNVEESRQKVRVTRLKQKFGKKETALERYFEAALKKTKIHYMRQHSIERYCTPDFIILDKKIAIFCDGEYWHPVAGKAMKKLNTTQLHNLEVDARQNALLKKRGWTVLRFTEHEIYTDIDNVIKKLQKICH